MKIETRIVAVSAQGKELLRKERARLIIKKMSIGKERWRWSQDFHLNMLTATFKSKTFLGSIAFMIIVPQKISDNLEGATNQLDIMKNAIYPFSKNKETILMVWSSSAG